jgi:uncharacterized protein YdeI (YjbR/CyaY-like superfamily)
MKMARTLHVTTRPAWRAWLRRYHDRETEVWLIFYKSHTGRPRVSYDEAVDEALCYGWIDSIVQRLDEDTYAQKFTPRRDTSTWSALNKRRLARLIRERRMTSAGLAKLNFAVADGGDRQEPTTETTRAHITLPAEIERGLRANREAWACFKRLAPSYRRNYVLWITAAKRPETRERRLQEAVVRLAQGKTLGLK